MKAIVLALALTITGCAAHQPVAAPIPGQTDALDGQVYRGLRDIQAAIDTYKQKVLGGTFHPTPTMAARMNDLMVAYNTTYAAWQLYHSAATPSQATALQANYNDMEGKYTAALTTGAPLPPLAKVQ